MHPSDRPWAAADGHLSAGFRGRDLSGLRIDQIQHLERLLVDIGPPSWATGPTAAALFGFDGFALRPPFHILVMRGRNVRRIGHVVHTTTQLDPIDRETVFGLPSVSPTRALLALSGMVDAEQLTIAVDAALRDGLTSDDFIHRRIGALRTKGRYGIPKLLDVLDGSEVVRGGHSWLEREVLRLIAGAGIPRPTTQAHVSMRRRRLIRVDFRWDGTPVVLEALGYRWHRTGAQMSADAARMNRLLLDGFLPLQVTYRNVVEEPESVVATIVEALTPHLGGTLPRSA